MLTFCRIRIGFPDSIGIWCPLPHLLFLKISYTPVNEIDDDRLHSHFGVYLLHSVARMAALAKYNTVACYTGYNLQGVAVVKQGTIRQMQHITRIRQWTLTIEEQVSATRH